MVCICTNGDGLRFGCVPRAVYSAMIGRGREDYSFRSRGVTIDVQRGWAVGLALIKEYMDIFTSKCYNPLLLKTLINTYCKLPSVDSVMCGHCTVTESLCVLYWL